MQDVKAAAGLVRNRRTAQRTRLFHKADHERRDERRRPDAPAESGANNACYLVRESPSVPLACLQLVIDFRAGHRLPLGWFRPMRGKLCSQLRKEEDRGEGTGERRCACSSATRRRATREARTTSGAATAARASTQTHRLRSMPTPSGSLVTHRFLQTRTAQRVPKADRDTGTVPSLRPGTVR
jgi:hypothetical protein